MTSFSTPRLARAEDLPKIWKLYQKVGQQLGGLARTSDEINTQYISQIMLKSAQTGLQLVIQEVEQGQIVAEIHCYKLEPRVFSHVLTDLTVAVDPDFQGQGLGKMIFSHLLDYIGQHRPDILRLELIARESNQKAIALYQKLGFVIEGRLEKRIKNKNSENWEADIPMAWLR